MEGNIVKKKIEKKRKKKNLLITREEKEIEIERHVIRVEHDLKSARKQGDLSKETRIILLACPMYLFLFFLF